MRWTWIGGLALVGCGGVGDPTASPSVASSPTALAWAGAPHAAWVASYTPGVGAGFGQDLLPEIVLGPPEGGGASTGSVDVLSLGQGGEIVLGLGVPVVDGPGVDLLVFENAFAYGSGPEDVFAEPGEVAVSLDGVAWVAFPCAPEAAPWEGCAGRTPVLANAANGIDPTDPELAGGDGFDLGAVGVAEALYVRIRDRGASTTGPSAGFDLDAVSVVNPRP